MFLYEQKNKTKSNAPRDIHKTSPGTVDYVKAIKHRSAYICEQQKIKTDNSELLRAYDHVILSDVIFVQTQKVNYIQTLQKLQPMDTGTLH